MESLGFSIYSIMSSANSDSFTSPFPLCDSAGKESICSGGDDSAPRLGRSPGKGKGYPIQYSDLENATDCIVHGVAKSRTRLSDFHIHFPLCITFVFLFWLLWVWFPIWCWIKVERVGILVFFQILDEILSVFHWWVWGWLSVQSLTRVLLFATPWTAAHQFPSPSTIPRAYTNSCPSSQWCHPTISSSLVPFSSLLQSLLAPGSFPMSQFFKSGGQSIGVSALVVFVPMNIQDWFPLGWTGWISLQSKGLSRVFFNTTVQKHQLFGTQLSL